MPAKGEKLSLGDIGQTPADARVQAALKKLAADKAPQGITQMVMWNLAAGLDWDTIGRIAKPWANPYEFALARQFVAGLDKAPAADAAAASKAPFESGVLLYEVSGDAAAASAFRAQLNGKTMLGLTTRDGIPARPEGPAVAFRVNIAAKGEASVTVAITDGPASSWLPVGKFSVTVPQTPGGDAKPDALADAVAEGLISRLVVAKLSKGPRVKNKETFKIKVENYSPLILNGLSVVGTAADADAAELAKAMTGMSLPPRRSVSFSATGEIVEKLGLKAGIKVYAADLSGL